MSYGFDKYWIMWFHMHCIYRSQNQRLDNVQWTIEKAALAMDTTDTSYQIKTHCILYVPPAPPLNLAMNVGPE